MGMAATRIVLGVTAAMLAAWPTGCADSLPARRNIEVVYRFENLRKQTASGAGAMDEWSAVKSILDGVSSRPVVVSRFGVRTLGTLEIADYEAKCLLPSLAEFGKVQADLEALGSGDHGGRRERVETFLNQVSATYKSNFVAATVNVGLSGAGVAGHRLRIYGMPGNPPVETTVGSSGIWVVRLEVVPQTQWVYGMSEDPAGRIPTRYFRMNVSTKQQERVEEAAFVKMFPPITPGQAPTSKAVPAAKPAAGGPAVVQEDAALQERRRREDDEIRKRREAEEKRVQDRRAK
jgi:hypothetical protein